MMPKITDLERGYVEEVLRGAFRAGGGVNMTKRLEEAFARAFDCEFAIAFANGTATLHAALAAAGVGPGDEVIVPPLTMASTSFAVLHAGATPVFADVDPRAWTIDPASIESRITPRTRAIIPVAIYGLAPDFAPIMEIARRHGLTVIEDDAQCFLGKYRGRVVGSFGHAASFSFQSSKHMTCGEGGMVTTNDLNLARTIRRFNSLGYAAVDAKPGQSKISKDVIQDPGYVRHISVGWNYRLSELCAAVALAQCERLPELVEGRVHAAERLAEAMAGCRWLTPQRVPDGTVHSYWTLAVSLDPASGVEWADFRRKYMELGGDGIYAAWRITYLEPVFQGKRLGPCQWQDYEPGLCPVAESLQPTLLQFKTNYFSEETLANRVRALQQTVRHFNG